MTGRKPSPTPEGAELAALKARVDQALQLADEAFRNSRGNRQLADLACDIRLIFGAITAGRR